MSSSHSYPIEVKCVLNPTFRSRMFVACLGLPKATEDFYVRVEIEDNCFLRLSTKHSPFRKVKASVRVDPTDPEWCKDSDMSAEMRAKASKANLLLDAKTLSTEPISADFYSFSNYTKFIVDVTVDIRNVNQNDTAEEEVEELLYDEFAENAEEVDSDRKRRHEKRQEEARKNIKQRRK